MPVLYECHPKAKQRRQRLWDLYLIQFIKWGQHPILNYKYSSAVRRQYKKVFGWTLSSEWEYKIDYLEKIVLFGQEPILKPWETELRKRIAVRQRRKEAEQLRYKLAQMVESEATLECQKLGICKRCLQPLIPLMIDCVNCGATQ